MSIHKLEHILYELYSVKEFMNTVGQEVPTVYTIKNIVFRKALIIEEVGELKDAVKTRNNVEIVDALMDILYVAYGAILSLGILEDYINLVENTLRK